MDRHVVRLFAWLRLTFVQNRRPRMKPQSRAVSTIAAVACAAILLIPSPAPGAEEDFFQKFILDSPMDWSGFYVGFNNGATFNHFDLGKHMTDVDLTHHLSYPHPPV